MKTQITTKSKIVFKRITRFLWLIFCWPIIFGIVAFANNKLDIFINQQTGIYGNEEKQHNQKQLMLHVHLPKLIISWDRICLDWKYEGMNPDDPHVLFPHGMNGYFTDEELWLFLYDDNNTKLIEIDILNIFTKSYLPEKQRKDECTNNLWLNPISINSAELATSQYANFSINNIAGKIIPVDHNIIEAQWKIGLIQASKNIPNATIKENNWKLRDLLKQNLYTFWANPMNVYNESYPAYIFSSDNDEVVSHIMNALDYTWNIDKDNIKYETLDKFTTTTRLANIWDCLKEENKNGEIICNINSYNEWNLKQKSNPYSHSLLKRQISQFSTIIVLVYD